MFFFLRPLDHATIEMKSAGAHMFARQTQHQSAEGNQAYFDNKFVELMKEMATKKGIDNLHATTKKQNDKIHELESRITIVERQIVLLQNIVDDNEQYNRRMHLRINGIPPMADGERETAEMCLEKVENV